MEVGVGRWSLNGKVDSKSVLSHPSREMRNRVLKWGRRGYGGNPKGRVNKGLSKVRVPSVEGWTGFWS